MPVMNPSEGQSWDSNVYVQASTRILVMIGVGYLVRFLYFQLSSTWGSRPASIAAAFVNDLSLEAIGSDTPATASEDTRLGPALEANITLEASLPHGGINPEDGQERSRVNNRAYIQRMEGLVPSTAAEPIPEQDAGVRVNNIHSEGGRGIATDLGE